MSAKAKKPGIAAKNYLIAGPGDHPCGNNLYLVVTDGEGRNRSFRYQRDGIKKKMYAIRSLRVMMVRVPNFRHFSFRSRIAL